MIQTNKQKDKELKVRVVVKIKSGLHDIFEIFSMHRIVEQGIIIGTDNSTTVDRLRPYEIFILKIP